MTQDAPNPAPEAGTAAATAQLIARICDETKAVEIQVHDLTGRSSLADFFVICSGNSEPHLRAIAERVREVLSEQGRLPHGTDGDAGNQWVVQDYGSVILHIFHPEARRHFNIESLWRNSKGEAPSRWLCPDSEILADEPLGRRPPPAPRRFGQR